MNDTDYWFRSHLGEQLKKPMNQKNLKDSEVTEEEFSATLTQSAQQLLEILNASMAVVLQGRHAEINQFEVGIQKIWGRALDLLEMLLIVATEAGEDFGTEYNPAPLRDGEFALRVVMDLHARACQVGFEILTLLKSGYPDGAHARWRTLHELSVTADFIAKHGNALAERYIRHESIESYKAAQQYQEKCAALGQEPLAQEQLMKLKDDRDELIERFGASYINDYGWASSIVGRESPSFRDIEESVGLDHLRPYFKMASYNIHASPKGIMFKLGVPATKFLHLRGPSNIGFAEPGHGTALSLHQITATLLASKRNIARILTMKTTEILVVQIREAFLEIHTWIEGQNN